MEFHQTKKVEKEDWIFLLNQDEQIERDVYKRQGVFGPIVENRTLEAIRQNLMDPQSQGPEIVYSIAMDVGNNQDKQAMLERNLLYGAVTYAKGTIGKEPVRSQGHIHACLLYTSSLA